MKLLNRTLQVRTILDTLYLIKYSTILNEGIDAFNITQNLIEDKLSTKACI